MDMGKPEGDPEVWRKPKNRQRRPSGDYITKG
jgi:hypothetical protein